MIKPCYHHYSIITVTISITLSTSLRYITTIGAINSVLMTKISAVIFLLNIIVKFWCSNAILNSEIDIILQSFSESIYITVFHANIHNQFLYILNNLLGGHFFFFFFCIYGVKLNAVNQSTKKIKHRPKKNVTWLSFWYCFSRLSNSIFNSHPFLKHSLKWFIHICFYLSYY